MEFATPPRCTRGELEAERAGSPATMSRILQGICTCEPTCAQWAGAQTGGCRGAVADPPQTCGDYSAGYAPEGRTSAGRAVWRGNCASDKGISTAAANRPRRRGGMATARTKRARLFHDAATGLVRGGVMQHLHSPKWRAARLIAMARLILASFSLLAVWLQPVEPRESAWSLRSFLAAYAVDASGVLALVWRARAPLPYPIVRHVVDVLVFAAFLYRGAGVSSPLFPLLGFLLLAASLQWQSRGTLWTAGATLLAFGGVALQMRIWQPERLEVNEFIIRGVSLVVMALLLVEFGRYEQRVRRDMQKLATEPRVAGGDVNEVARNLPSWTADVMGARRALIAWEEPDEPRLCLAWSEAGTARFAREAPGVLE